MTLDLDRHISAWRSRVGVENHLVRFLDEWLDGAYCSGYTQALIDNGLPTGELAARLEQRSAVREEIMSASTIDGQLIENAVLQVIQQYGWASVEQIMFTLPHISEAVIASAIARLEDADRIETRRHDVLPPRYSCKATIVLDEKSADAFEKALANPPPPTEKLRELAAYMAEMQQRDEVEIEKLRELAARMAEMRRRDDAELDAAILQLLVGAEHLLTLSEIMQVTRAVSTSAAASLARLVARGEIEEVVIRPSLCGYRRKLIDEGLTIRPNHTYQSAGDTAGASGDRPHTGCYLCGRPRSEHEEPR